MREARGHAIVVLDEKRRLRHANERATSVFADLDEAIGQAVEEYAPELSSVLDAGDDAIDVDVEGAERSFLVSESTFTGEEGEEYRVIVFGEAVDAGRYRPAFDRESARVERLASMISHDLRNPLSVARGRLALETDGIEGDHVPIAEEALERMETMIENIVTLARTGHPIEETENVNIAELAERAWQNVVQGEATLEVTNEVDRHLDGDPARLRLLFEHLYRNAIDHGGADVRVTVGTLGTNEGFYVEDDGDGIPEADREAVFEPRFSTDEAAMGFGLSIVTEIANVHRWSIKATESSSGGARFEIRTAPR